jgi:hypothetical protein
MPPTGGQPYRNAIMNPLDKKFISDEVMAELLGIPIETMKYLLLYENKE